MEIKVFWRQNGKILCSSGVVLWPDHTGLQTKGNMIFPPFLHPNPLRRMNQVQQSIKGFRSKAEHLPGTLQIAVFFHF